MFRGYMFHLMEVHVVAMVILMEVTPTAPRNLKEPIL